MLLPVLHRVVVASLLTLALTACGRVAPRPIPTTAQPGLTPVAVALGSYHSCLLDGLGTVHCWGDDRWGQLGDGALVPRARPQIVRGLPRIRQIAAGSRHTCALAQGGEVYCWGTIDPVRNSGPQPTPRRVTTIGPAVQLAVHGAQTCVVTQRGTVECWGGNANARPPRTLELTEALEVALYESTEDGTTRVCVRRRAGKISCWGRDDEATEPWVRNMTVSAEPVQLVVGRREVCSLAADGRVQCESFVTAEAPAPPRSTFDWRARYLAVDSGSICAVLAEGIVSCPHADEAGSYGESPRLAAIAALHGVVQVAFGLGHACAVDGRGSTSCWGDSSVGQVGSGLTRYSRAHVVNLPATRAIELGRQACALGTDGRVRCWAPDSLAETSEPKPVPDLAGATSITVYENEGCAALHDGDVYCWGEPFGPMPAREPALAGSVEVALGGLDLHQAYTSSGSEPSISTGHVCGRKPDGSVVCTTFQFDFHTRKPMHSAPRVTTPFRDAAQLSGGQMELCARTTDGRVSCLSADPDVPSARVHDLNDVIDVAVGGYTSCATLRDGSAACWEWAAKIQNRMTGVRDASRPELWRPLLLRKVTRVSPAKAAWNAGRSEAHEPVIDVCATERDGRVVCWDPRTSFDSTFVGEPGQSPPQQVVIEGVENAVSVAVGTDYACALIRDGGVRCWKPIERPVVMQPTRVEL